MNQLLAERTDKGGLCHRCCLEEYRNKASAYVVREEPEASVVYDPI